MQQGAALPPEACVYATAGQCTCVLRTSACHESQRGIICFRPSHADIIGSVTLLVVKGDERVGAYRQQMQHLQAYAQMNALPQVRGAGCSAGGKG